MNRRLAGVLPVLAALGCTEPNPSVCEQTYQCMMDKGEVCLHPGRTQLAYEQEQCEMDKGPEHPDCEALWQARSAVQQEYKTECWDQCVPKIEDPQREAVGLGAAYDEEGEAAGIEARKCLWSALLSAEELALWGADAVAEWEAACAYTCPDAE